MAGAKALLNKVRRICLALPDTKETPTWGKPHFRVGEKYVGHKGWVSMDLSDADDWDEVKELVLESYRLIAPKRSLARLDA